MKTIGVIANCSKPEASSVLNRLATQARALGLRIVSFGETAGHLHGCEQVTAEAMAEKIDVLIAVGGDGTMLQAAHLIRNSSAPLLGVNLGYLGFLTSTSQNDLEQALEHFARGNYTLSERTTIACTVWRGGEKLGESRALNDVVVGWGQSSHIIVFEVTVDGEPATSYRCDGIIVATPTGSTGHSLSAGGPIVHPETAALLINVISPHALTARPVLLPQQHVVGITVAESSKELLGSIDGQELYKLRQGDRLVVRTSPDRVRFIHLPGYNYFDVLRQKLHWRGSSVSR